MEVQDLAQGIPSSDNRVRICLLGPPALLARDGSRSPLNSSDALLLWRLAATAALSTQDLARQLWPTQPQAAAANSLRQRVFRLRRRGVPLLLEGGRLNLAGGADVDWLAPEPHADLAPARWAATDLLAGVDAAEPGLADLLRQARADWLRRRTELARAHARSLGDDGDDTAALAWLHGLLAAVPQDQATCRALMTLHLQRGDRAAAVEVFERTERQLQHQGRDALEPATVALLREMLGVDSAVPSPRRRLPAMLLRPPRLIERERELAQAMSGLQAGQVVVLLGDAGMGKSRLAQELCAVSAEAGLQIWALAGTQPAEAPFALLTRLLRLAWQTLGADRAAALPWSDPDWRPLALLLPDWAERRGVVAPPIDLQSAGLLVMEAATRMLRACLQRDGDGNSNGNGAAPQSAASRVLVLIDDLHLVDAASLEWLQSWWAQADASDAPLWLLTARPAELPAVWQGASDLLQARTGLADVNLQPWSSAALADLLDDLRWRAAVDVTTLARQLGGNPFHVLEALRLSWPENGQGDIRVDGTSGAVRLIQARVRQLGPQARRLAEAAAVAGPSWRPELAARVLGHPLLMLADSWRELEDAQILAGSAPQPDGRPGAQPVGGISHDLVRHALLQDLPDARSQQIHEALALALADNPEVPAAELARLWQGGLRWREAAQAWSAASGQAARLGRPVEQLALARQALAAWQRAGEPAQAFDLWFHCSDAMTFSEGIAGLDTQCDQLLAWADSPARQARAEVMRAFCRLNQSRLDEAQALLDLASTRLVDAPTADPALWIDLQRTRALVLMMQGRTDTALLALEALDALVQAAGSPLQRLQHLGALSALYNALRRVGQAIDALERASAEARAQANQVEEAVHRQNLVVSLGQAGRCDDALATASQVRLMHDRLGSKLGLHGPISRLNEAQVLLQFGRFGDALALLEQGHAALPASAAVWHVSSLHRLALAWLWVGQLGRARQILRDDLPDNLTAATRCQRHLLRACLVRFEQVQLDVPVAVELQHLRAAREAWADTAPALVSPEQRLRLCRGLPVEQALQIAREVADTARRQGAHGIELPARIVALQALGHIDSLAAAAEAECLLPLLPAGLGVDWLPTEMLAMCADALSRAGRHDLVGQARRRALDWLRDAQAHTPDAWRTSLWSGNPWHRALAAGHAGSLPG